MSSIINHIYSCDFRRSGELLSFETHEIIRDDILKKGVENYYDYEIALKDKMKITILLPTQNNFGGMDDRYKRYKGQTRLKYINEVIKIWSDDNALEGDCEVGINNWIRSLRGSINETELIFNYWRKPRPPIDDDVPFLGGFQNEDSDNESDDDEGYTGPNRTNSNNGGYPRIVFREPRGNGRL